MYCFNCGTQIEDGTKVCPQCNQAQPIPQEVYPVHYVYVKPKIPGRGLGIAGMVLGILGLISCLSTLFLAINVAVYPQEFVFNITDLLSEATDCFIFPILALALAGAGRGKGYRTGISTSGIVMGTIGLVVSLISTVIMMIVG